MCVCIRCALAGLSACWLACLCLLSAACCWLAASACWLLACWPAACCLAACWLLVSNKKRERPKATNLLLPCLCLAWPLGPALPLASYKIFFCWLPALPFAWLAACLLPLVGLPFACLGLILQRYGQRWPYFVVIFNDLSICLQQAGLGRWPLPACCLSQI